MQLSDINITRTRWSDSDNWQYELCSEDDLDNYYNCESAYSYCQEFRNAKMEVVYTGDIHFSEEVLERIKEGEAHGS